MSTRSHWSSRLPPWGTGLVVFAAAGLLAGRLVYSGRREAGRAVVAAATSVRDELSSRVTSRRNLFEQIAARWQFDGERSPRHWQFDADLALRCDPVLEGVAWINRDGGSEWISSTNSPGSPPKVPLGRVAKWAGGPAGVRMERDLGLLPAGSELDLITAVYLKGELAGWLAGVYATDRFFERLLGNVAPGYQITVTDGEAPFFERTEPKARAGGPVSTMTLPILAREWRITTAAAASPALAPGYALPLWLLAGGGLLAMVLGAALQQARQLRKASAEYQAARAELEEEVHARRWAETVLRESELRFRNAFEHAGIGMALVSLEGKWLRVNKSLCEIVGYSAEELRHLTFQDITHPDDLSADLALAGRLLAGELRSYQMEKRYYHKAGHEVWILLTGSVLRDDQGKPLYFISQIEDINARRRAEAALRQTTAELTGLLRHSPQLIVISDRESRCLLINDAAARVLGCDSRQAVGQPFAAIAPADVAAIFQERLARLVAGEGSFVEEDTHEVGGVLRHFSTTFFAMPDDAGGTAAYCAIAADITERVAAEQALRESEQLFRATFDQAFQLAALLRPDGTVIEVNQAALRLLGLPREEIIGRNFGVIYGERLRPEIAGRLGAAIGAATRGEVVRIEENIENRGEQAATLDLLIKPLRDESGVVRLVIPEGRDISEHKRAVRELEATLLEKETLLREVHHRVKNNLQVIGSLFQLQLGATTDPAAQMAIRESQSRIQAMALVHEMLCQEQGQGRIDFVAYLRSLGSMLLRTGSTGCVSISLEINAESAALNLDTAIPAGLALNELVTNALKHAFCGRDAGCIRIGLRGTPTQGFLLTVADDGAGLPDDFRSRRGNSLGVRLVKLLAAQLDGQADWASLNGTIVTFKFYEIFRGVPQPQ